jgi:ABC-type polysaccharide/polyol phosphate transport system ATPase subunit
VLVTHDLHTVETWCHQALWLDRGVVLGLGDPGEQVRRYSEYVTAMLENAYRLGLYP